MKTLHQDRYQSPLGEIVIIADGAELCYLDFADNAQRLDKLLRARYRRFRLADAPDALGLRARLDAYFAGDWNAFDGVAINSGGTDFQRAVWRGLRRIPVGRTISYQQLAQRLNRPSAVRAAASANARNPISIIVPCHRVIGADGSLRGYAGGVHRKSWLLTHEGAMLA
ncbi:MAG: methylated-DNA--[protein]-cysteine S-methyltransferase [bacterium]